MRNSEPHARQNVETLLLFAQDWIVEPLRKTITCEVKKMENRFVHLRLGVKADLEEMQEGIRERLDGIEVSLEIIAREVARKAGSEPKEGDGTA